MSLVTLFLASFAVRTGVQKLLFALRQVFLAPLDPNVKDKRRKFPLVSYEPRSHVKLHLNLEENNADRPNSEKEVLILGGGKKKPRRCPNSQPVEKQCAQLRDEIIHIQSNCMNEQASLNRRVEVLTKEKKSLTKQLAVAQKESKTARDQLEEILREKSSLLERLENATREIKASTKCKKETLARLEEALANSDKLKQKYDQISRDKEILEDKLKVLEKDFNILKQQRFNESSTRSREHAVDRNECGDHLKSTEYEDFDVSQSEKDMRKVQEKLVSLEKSLEKLKSKEVKNAERMLPPLREVLEENPSWNSICVEPECPLEHQHCSRPECIALYNMKVGHEKGSGEEDDDTVYQVHHSLSEPLDLQARYEDVEVINFTKAGGEGYFDENDDDDDDRLSVISEHSTIVTEKEEESFTEESKEKKPGIVSNSPAFLEFLVKVLETPV